MDADDYRRTSHEVSEAMAPGWEKWQVQIAELPAVALCAVAS
jgi:hypothetical protein